MNARPADPARQGVVYGMLAYACWGLVPLYFKLVAEVSSEEVLAQRVVWSFVLLSLVITLLRRWPQALAALRTRGVLLTLTASTLLLSLNWFTYIYAVASNQVVEASIGYFLNPLVNMLIGVLILNEHMRPWQLASIALAGIGVLILGVPLIAVSLALTFAFYGLLRKKVAVDGLLGLLIETGLLVPIATAYLLWRQREGTLAFRIDNPSLCLTLMAAGIVTSVPLLFFAAAARRLRFSTLGFLQYIAPTMQFLLAVFLFHEELTTTKIVALTCIWTAVAIYSLDSLRAYHRVRFEPQPVPADV